MRGNAPEDKIVPTSVLKSLGKVGIVIFYELMNLKSAIIIPA